MTRSTLNWFLGSIAAVTLACALICAFLALRPTPAAASSIGFLVPRIATSSTMQVGPQAVQTIGTSTRNCYSRVVSSVASPLQLSFSYAITPTGAVGHSQAASTTITYNNGDFGCGPIRIYAYASTTITISEFSQFAAN